MKAKTIETSCFHKKYTSIIYDNGGGRLVYINPTNTTKRMANVNTRQFNSALSAHVAKETAPLLAEIDRLKKEVERLGKENDNLRVAYKELERKFHVASASVKEANELLSDPKKLGEYIAGM